MEIPSVSATHGFARSLPAKLKRLLDAEDNNNGLQLSKGEKKKIGLLKHQLKQICESLMDPSEVEFPTSAAKCWLVEVRELSYDIDDFFEQLASKRPKKWISSEVSRFTIRLDKAIQRYEIYSLKKSKMRQQSCITSFGEERPPPPLFGFEDAYPIGIDDSVVDVEKWLTDQGEPKRRVVAIVGLGGVGKTTLASKLYRNLRKEFPCHAFVRSSQMPDMRGLLTSILVQVRPDVTPKVSEWCNLTNTIRAHLQQKKYFIVIDGLWTLSTWDLILQALPDDDNCFSRILTTTEVDAVAYRCCGHNSNHMLRMEPLSKDRTRELFFSRFGGNQPELSKLSPEILSKCGGFPLAIVSISSLLEKWSSLSSNLKTNPTVKGMKKVLSLCYNSLPDHLKTCMLYLSIYKQGHIIQKNDLVKQWIAEGFICAKQGKDIEEVASSYFDELVIRGMIQPVHNSHNGQVNSCTVHYMILQFIQCKSIEENFVITIHHSETNMRLGDMVRRLSLHFGDAEDAKQPDRLELSQVRTLAFYGVIGCMPPLAKFRLLRVIILDLWADKDDIQFKVPTFCMLRYLQIACNVKVMLQIELYGLQYLETLKIDSRISEVPQNIVDLPRLLHLSLPGDTNLPNCIGHMSSLRTFGCFNLSSSSSADNVQSLDKLTDLRDLHLTCSTTISRNLEENFGILSSVLPKLSKLKSLTLLPEENSSSANILGASSTDKNIPCDHLLTVSPLPGLLQKLELSPKICIFSRLPGWIGDLSNLSILKIAASELSQSEIDTLNCLTTLSALLLYVSIAPSKRIILKEGFPVLKHFKFVCSTLCLAFQEGAMPSLRSLKLGFNTNRSDLYRLAKAGFENLKLLSAFSAKIGCAGAREHGTVARSALEDALRSGERQPIINIHLVDRVFGCDEETSTVGRTDKAQTPEKADVIITGCGGPTKAYQTGNKNSSPATKISRDDFRTTVLSDPTSTTGNQAKMSGAIRIVIVKIDSIIQDDSAKATIKKLSAKVQSLKELPQKVDQIRMKLIVMDKDIQQIGAACLTDELAKSWIREVQRVVYHVEDVVDKYSYHLLQLEKEGFLKKYFVKGTHYAIVFSEIVDEVAEIEGKIQQTIQLKDHWLQPSQHYRLAEIERQRYQDSFLELFKDEDLVGIEENRKLLTGWIYSQEQASTVITVSGMGGLGKSTLVANIYEREKVNFPVHAWMVVSQIYTVESLLRKLLWKIGHMEPPVPKEIDKMDVHDLKEEIKRKFQNRKCLIVLDDVWEQDVYTKIHDAFQTLQESCIIITTRNDHVGAVASFGQHLELQPLCGPDAFELFCRRAFHRKKDHKCPEELQEIASKIVKRCHGLPLAVVTIGSMLSSRLQIKFWNQTYNQLQSELLTDDHVRAILNLSYHDLSGDLRNCFLYCSLFPEDYSMSRETLVRLWVAEDFLLSKENYTLEEVAEGNLMELIHRNMLEVVDYDELGRVSTCMMHPIIRDQAIYIGKEEMFASANDYGELIVVDKNVRRLSICGWNVNASSKVKFPCLRTLLAPGIISFSPDMISSIMSQSSYLKVLELQHSEITEVPTFIGNLFNLRYIGLRRTKVKSLPESIGNLFNLQTLDIKETQIEKLPRGIVKVKKLRHLLADRIADEEQSEFRYFVGVEAPKGLLNLEELQTLETVQVSKDLAEQLKKLMELRSIWIDNVTAADCASLFSTLSKMPLLSSLLISARDVNETLYLQALAPEFPKLHKLIVRGRWANETLQYPIFCNHGAHLKYLALEWCHLAEDPLGVLAPHVPNLTYLSFNRVNSASTLVLSARCFPHLKTLVLKKMPDVQQLEIEHGGIPCIEGLYIMCLVKLDKVPQGIESLLSLKKLWLLNLHREFRTQWLTNRMEQKMQHVSEIRL